ncbi:MAG: M67 family peptidase [Dehalococcoidia bacterium]|nr:M67 family peptidase [Dehalococcoidia bacterium]
MIAHALQDDPNECCGIIASRNGRATKFFRMANPEHSPYRYSMDSKELFKVTRELDDAGWEVMGIYHSHTHTEAYPSPTDVRLAAYPEAFYLLVSLMDKQKPVVNAYRIVEGQITKEPLNIAKG